MLQSCILSSFTAFYIQVASVGLSDEEAKAKGLDYKTGNLAFMANK
jgi:pyruvate/2-oxoglutarate dehydrogenase complex dihydrolipoamide dehydrogenase (E3) component